MNDLNLTVLAKPLFSIAKVVLPHVRRVYAERKAGQLPVGEGIDILDEVITETLERLCRGDVSDTWWEKILHSIEHPFVTPDFLKHPALQVWLKREDVQQDLKALARSIVMGEKNLPTKYWVNLRNSYAEITDIGDPFATEAITVVLAVFSAGYLASIPKEQRPLAGMIQEGFRETKASLDEISRRVKKVGPNRFEVANNTEEVEKILTSILKRRSLEAESTRQEIRGLTQRIENGDLVNASSTVKEKVLCWAARLHAGQAETLGEAKGYLKTLYEINPTTDARIVDALILATEEKADEALQLLRDIEDADGRSTFFITLLRLRGKGIAIEWFNENPNHNRSSFLTGIGWSNVAISLAEHGRWEEAAQYLSTAHEKVEDWPDLAFVEGVINAGMLLPGEMRKNALEMNLFHPAIHTIEGPQADKFRARAEECFALSEKLMAEIKHLGRVHAAKSWRRWLQLTNPRPEIAEQARKEVQEGMKDGARAVELLPFARAFKVQFDEEPIKRYLASRARFGGLSDSELFAEFILAEHKMDPHSFQAYLDREEEQLLRVVSKPAFTVARIHALLAVEQPDKAYRLLEKNKESLGDDYERLRAMIVVSEGGDARTQLELLYKQNDSLIDLENLIKHLYKDHDWGALSPLLIELFQRDRTTENALRVVECMRLDPKTESKQVVNFLESNQDLVENSPSLLSEQAWRLFYIGRWKEAKAINLRLLSSRKEEGDLILDTNLTLQSGEWERLPVIIEREWPHREELNAGTLMRLASLAAEVDTGSGRAIELARLAAKKAPDDPHILVNAYALAVQLGRENDVNPEWLTHAAEISSDTGPVWKVDIRTLIEEMAPAHRERTQWIEEALIRGEIPLHYAAHALNVPLSHILLEIPFRNTDEQDGRRRTMLPILSGARMPVEIKEEWTVGLDVTSVLVLWHLGLLSLALDTFARVVLAPDTMLFLLDQRRRARFHQPSRVSKAEELRGFIDKGYLKVAESMSEPPQWLIDEVGCDLAQLLITARSTGGYLIHPRPIFKLKTFLQEKAELGEFAEVVLSTTAFAHGLFERGSIDSATYERAQAYLRAHDQDRDSEANSSVFSGSLYLSDLALTHIQEAGLLRAASTCELDLSVHPSTTSEQVALIAANRQGQRLADALNDIRTCLQDALEADKAIFLPQISMNSEEVGESEVSHTSSNFEQFFRDLGQCDAICIDDRFLNKHAIFTDKTGRAIPTISMLDILHFLEEQEAIKTEQKWETYHRLRQGGFAHVPLSAEELAARLGAARLNKEGCVIEGAELRIIRQTFMRIRSLDAIQQPLENQMLDRLRLACVQVIFRLWRDNEVSIERAAALTDWIWQNIAPSPLDWGRTSRGCPEIMPISEAFGLHLALLTRIMPSIKGDRKEAFRNWLQDTVIMPLLMGNAGLLDEVEGFVTKQIRQFASEISDDEDTTENDR